MYLRTGNEILEETRALMRDSTSQRWSVVEGQLALNLALRSWSERVWVPMAYEVPGGWVENQREYVLPDWMPLPITPQFEREEWADLGYFTIEATATGQRVLRWEVPTASGPGRILWQYRNQSVPISPSSTIQVDVDNGLMIHLLNLPAAGIPPVGLVFIASSGASQEWVLYRNVVANASYLSNVTRGALGSIQQSHVVGAPVEWGIAAPRADLFGQLVRQIAANLHEMYLHQVSNSSPSARATHQQMVSYYRQQEGEYWATYNDYTSTPKLRLNRKALHL